MSKIKLHLAYKNETGNSRPVELNCINDIDPLEMAGMSSEEVMEIKLNEIIDYIEWLEGIAESIINIDPNLIQILKNKPQNILKNIRENN